MDFRFAILCFGLAFTIYNVIAARYEAQEAHRHTHELACHVGAADLCDYHTKGDTP